MWKQEKLMWYELGDETKERHWSYKSEMMSKSKSKKERYIYYIRRMKLRQ